MILDSIPTVIYFSIDLETLHFIFQFEKQVELSISSLNELLSLFSLFKILFSQFTSFQSIQKVMTEMIFLFYSIGYSLNLNLIDSH